jgi:hypothetical protein
VLNKGRECPATVAETARQSLAGGQPFAEWRIDLRNIIRFEDLKQRRIINNWPALKKLSTT